MLTYKLTDNILEVTEIIHSWCESKYSYWYYDIEKWRQSSNGKQNDKIDRDMVESSIDWVKTHYLTKILK